MGTESADRLETREKQVLWISGYYKKQGVEPGSFYNCLINAFFKADSNNFQRLKSAFPITAQAYENYMNGSLREKYNLPDD